MAKVSKDGGRLHIKMADELCADIRAGKYSASRLFPSLTRIMNRFGVTRVTAMRIVDELKRRGVITAVPRSRIVVKNVNRTIGLIVPGIAYSEFFPPIVSEISRLAQKEGYTLFFGDVSSRSADQRARAAKRLAKDFVLQNVAGVLYQPVELVDDVERVNRDILSVFSRANIPVVMLDNDFTVAPRRSGYDVIGIDNVSAGMAVAEHLLSTGVRKVHFQSRPRCSASVIDRRNGVFLALSAAGAPVRHFRDLKAEPDDVAAIKAHLRRNRPEAFVCGNDAAAVKMKISLETLGYRIPDDIRLVGFDDVKYAKIVTPQLTTVHQPCEKIAEVAFRRLLARIVDPSLQPCFMALPYELVVRASSGMVAERSLEGTQNRMAKKNVMCQSLRKDRTK